MFISNLNKQVGILCFLGGATRKAYLIVKQLCLSYQVADSLLSRVFTYRYILKAYTESEVYLLH